MLLFNKKKANKKEGNRKYLQNPKILEVNLIKDEAKIFFNWNKNLLVLTLVLFLAGLFVVEIYLGLNWWEKQETLQAQSLTENISKINQEVSKLKNQVSAALLYKEKSAVFTELLNNHIYWSNFFSWLEKNTLSSVKYGGFSGDLSGDYTLDAKTDSFADVSWQVKAFLNDSLTQEVEVKNATAAKGRDRTKPAEVNFTLSLKVKPEIFKK